jgi:hypothetical protein
MKTAFSVQQRNAVFAPAVRSSRPVAARRLSVLAAVKVGDKAPDFALPDQVRAFLWQ